MAMRTICGCCLKNVKLVHVDDNIYMCPKCEAECEYDEDDDDFYWDEDTFPTDGDEDFDDIYGGKPDCCRGCGGDYPDCIDSCEIFDD